MRISMEAPALDTFDFGNLINLVSNQKKIVLSFWHTEVYYFHFFLLHYVYTSLFLTAMHVRRVKPMVSVFFELITAVSYDTTY